jgi:nucleoid-associated protein YgaU
VTVGRPSGGERFGNPAPAPAPAQAPAQANRPATSSASGPTPVAAPAPKRSGSTPAAPASASEWIVEPGQSLSRICATRYGSSRLDLVTAVARHNGLASADLVREGQRLDLPPVERLVPKR